MSFLSYINDLPDEVISRIFLFADDTKFYREIMNPGTVRFKHSGFMVKKVAFTVSPPKNVCSCQLVGHS